MYWCIMIRFLAFQAGDTDLGIIPFIAKSPTVVFGEALRAKGHTLGNMASIFLLSWRLMWALIPQVLQKVLELTQ